MTAAHAIQPVRTAPKHAAPKSPRLHRPSMPTLPKISAPKLPKRTARPAKPAGTARKITPTGEAMFSVAANGDTTRNIAQVGAGHFATFAQDAVKGMPDANNGWIVQLFETESERKNRQKAELALAAIGVGARMLARFAH